MDQARHLRAVEEQPTRRQYTPEFRASAVARVAAGESLSGVARSLELSRSTLRKWIVDAPQSDQSPADMRAAVSAGTERAFLVASRNQIASAIDAGVSPRELVPMLKLLEETIQKIRFIDAGGAKPSSAPAGPVEVSDAGGEDEAWEPI